MKCILISYLAFALYHQAHEDRSSQKQVPLSPSRAAPSRFPIASRAAVEIVQKSPSRVKNSAVFQHKLPSRDASEEVLAKSPLRAASPTRSPTPTGGNHVRASITSGISPSRFFAQKPSTNAIAEKSPGRLANLVVGEHKSQAYAIAEKSHGRVANLVVVGRKLPNRESSTPNTSVAKSVGQNLASAIPIHSAIKFMSQMKTPQSVNKMISYSASYSAFGNNEKKTSNLKTRVVASVSASRIPNAKVSTLTPGRGRATSVDRKKREKSSTKAVTSQSVKKLIVPPLKFTLDATPKATSGLRKGRSPGLSIDKILSPSGKNNKVQSATPKVGQVSSPNPRFNMLRSPSLNKDKSQLPSPSRKVRSPSTKARSPSTKARSPSTKEQLPSRKVRSPSTKVQSPSKKVQSPGTKEQSPSTKEQSPSRNVRSPSTKVQSPSTKVQSPSSNNVSVNKDRPSRATQRRSTKNTARQSLILNSTPSMEQGSSAQELTPRSRRSELLPVANLMSTSLISPNQMLSNKSISLKLGLKSEAKNLQSSKNTTKRRSEAVHSDGTMDHNSVAEIERSVNNPVPEESWNTIVNTLAIKFMPAQKAFASRARSLRGSSGSTGKREIGHSLAIKPGSLSSTPNTSRRGKSQSNSTSSTVVEAESLILFSPIVRKSITKTKQSISFATTSPKSQINPTLNETAINDLLYSFAANKSVNSATSTSAKKSIIRSRSSGSLKSAKRTSPGSNEKQFRANMDSPTDESSRPQRAMSNLGKHLRSSSSGDAGMNSSSILTPTKYTAEPNNSQARRVSGSSHRNSISRAQVSHKSLSTTTSPLFTHSWNESVDSPQNSVLKNRSTSFGKPPSPSQSIGREKTASPTKVSDLRVPASRKTLMGMSSPELFDINASYDSVESQNLTASSGSKKFPELGSPLFSSKPRQSRLSTRISTGGFDYTNHRGPIIASSSKTLSNVGIEIGNQFVASTPQLDSGSSYTSSESKNRKQSRSPTKSTSTLKAVIMASTVSANQDQSVSASQSESPARSCEKFSSPEGSSAGSDNRSHMTDTPSSSDSSTTFKSATKLGESSVEYLVTPNTSKRGRSTGRGTAADSSSLTSSLYTSKGYTKQNRASVVSSQLSNSLTDIFGSSPNTSGTRSGSGKRSTSSDLPLSFTIAASTSDTERHQSTPASHKRKSKNVSLIKWSADVPATKTPSPKSIRVPSSSSRGSVVSMDTTAGLEAGDSSLSTTPGYTLSPRKSSDAVVETRHSLSATPEFMLSARKSLPLVCSQRTVR